MESNLNGTWLFVKTGDQYGDTDLIEFDGDDILHFLLKNTANSQIFLSNKIVKNSRICG